jgi:hypothetical protein
MSEHPLSLTLVSSETSIGPPVQEQQTYLIKFLLRIRGALTAAPTNDDPVNQMPQAAPTTDKPKPKAIPKFAQPYGDMCERTSPHPALQYCETQASDDDMIACCNLSRLVPLEI